MGNTDGVIFFVIAAVLFGVAALLDAINEPRATRFTLALVAGGLMAMSIAFIVERT
jgi:hypothetical protein